MQTIDKQREDKNISTEVSIWIDEITDQLSSLSEQEYELSKQRTEQEETLRWLRGLLTKNED